MDAVEFNLVRQIRQQVGESLDFKKEPSDDELRELIKDIVFERSGQSYIPLRDKRLLAEAVYNSIKGLDVLQPLMDDAEITEIMVNGPDDIFIEKRGRMSRPEIRFESRERLDDVIQAIVAGSNRAVNEASPIVDFRLKDGSRVNVVLGPVALNGPVMTIRKFPDRPLAMDYLVETGTVTAEAAEALYMLVRAGYNIFISGGTGSGKTTLLNALTGYIPEDERLVTIEDSAELQITGIANLVRLETRNANTEGRGRITVRDLIRTALRMRPERIIVGEVRGEEALDMLQAMNTGHDGSISTGHANSPEDMISRLETMVLSGASLPVEAIRQQIASAIDIIIHLSRMRDRRRRLVEIAEVAGCGEGRVLLNQLYVFKELPGSTDEKVLGELKRTDNPLSGAGKLRAAGFEAVL